MLDWFFPSSFMYTCADCLKIAQKMVSFLGTLLHAFVCKALFKTQHFTYVHIVMNLPWFICKHESQLKETLTWVQHLSCNVRISILANIVLFLEISSIFVFTFIIIIIFRIFNVFINLFLFFQVSTFEDSTAEVIENACSGKLIMLTDPNTDFSC